MGPCGVKVCTVCFTDDCQLHLLHENMELYKGYETVTGLKLADEEDLPPYLCTSCADQLMTCARFRHRSLQAHFMLLDILKNKGHISIESIQAATTKNDTDTEDTKKEIVFSEVTLEIKLEKNPTDAITDLTKVKTERVGDEGVGSSYVMETNVIIKEEVLDEASDNDMDDSEMGTGADGSLADDVPSGQKDNLNAEGARERKEVSDLNETEDTDVNEKPDDKLSCDLCNYENEIQLSGNNKALESTLHRCSKHDYKTVTNETKAPPYNFSHVCDVCGKTLSIKTLLTDHLRSHLGKDRSCGICKKTFSQKGNLQRHMLMHMGHKQYLCEVCNKLFRSKSNLQNHMLTHSGDKPHSCDVCEKSFRQKGQLQSHKLVHTGDKPYSCDVCEKSFRRKCDLQVHVLVHSGHKPHKCDVCQKTFRARSTLLTHKRIHARHK